MSRTEPIRIRAGVARAVKELAGADPVSDAASFLIILSIIQNEDLNKRLSPGAQRELGADLIDMLGDFLKLFALGLRDEKMSLGDLLEKVKEAKG